MIRVLVLGHRGMLGDAVYRHLSQTGRHEVKTISGRWPDAGFRSQISNTYADVIINCIGKIPQRNSNNESYSEVNIDLPFFLDSLGVRTIHPSTDCEFSGALPVGSRYTKQSRRDAIDAYGKSKAEVSEKIETVFSNTKIVRTSIIGHERVSAVSLLEWFLASEGTVRGFTNHYWNGITTLQWAQLAEHLIDQWESAPVLGQFGTDACQSKFSVLETIRDVYKKDIVIVPFEAPEMVNKCLESDRSLPNLKDQLILLNNFYTSIK